MELTVMLVGSPKRQNDECDILDDIGDASQHDKNEHSRRKNLPIILKVGDGYAESRHGVQENGELPDLFLRREVPDRCRYGRKEIVNIAMGVGDALEIKQDGVDHRKKKRRERQTHC